MEAAKLLVAEGKVAKADFPWGTDGYRKPQTEFIDGITFNGHTPNEYLKQFPIGLKGNEMVNGTGVVSN